jgi:hypothetical protein
VDTGGDSFLEIKWLGREAAHSPPFSAGVKKSWSYTSTAPYIFVEWSLMKFRVRLYCVVLGYRKHFNFTFIITFMFSKRKM